MEIQTDAEPGLLYHWNLDGGGGAPFAALGPRYGLGSVDPTPIATHTISADALESEGCTLCFFMDKTMQALVVWIDSFPNLHFFSCQNKIKFAPDASFVASLNKAIGAALSLVMQLLLARDLSC